MPRQESGAGDDKFGGDMTDRELMQQALDALEYYYDLHNEEPDRKAIKALRARLAQPECVCGEPDTEGVHRKDGPCYIQTEQEPVAWRYRIIPPSWTYSEEKPNREFAGSVWDRWQVQPLYLAPPQREWQGLTDEEVDDLWEYIIESTRQAQYFARAIEAKLREKNA